jgi:hypothetical protein
MKRVSPGVLVEWLEFTGKQYAKQLSLLDPFGKAIFSVGWAGEEESQNWFHIAREYTEKWHHQQQIREAVNQPGIMTHELYHPFLETFMRALPHTYRNTQAPNNTTIKVTITGEGGGDWQLVKKENGSIAWKLFSKSWRKKEAIDYITIEGNKELGEVAVDMISVMA